MAADAPHPAFEGYAAEAVPSAAVGASGKDGELALTFASDAEGRTRLARDYARTPFHVSGTLEHGPHPDGTSVFVQSPTGGVAQGDRLRVDVEARSGSVAHVSTGAATKVQSMERNYAAEETTLTVREGAHLDYVPEPTLLHADARFHRDTTLSVEPGGSAAVADVVVPGRLARGERFAFERYFARLRAESGGDLLFEDATHLRPGEEDPTAPGVLGEYSVYGTCFVVVPDWSDDASDRLHAAATEADSPARAGATALPNGAGVVVRALGDRADAVTDALHAAWDEARRSLVDAAAPRGRKY